MQAVRVDGLPIRVAQRGGADDVGPLGTALRAAPDLRSAYQILNCREYAVAGTKAGWVHDDADRGITTLGYLPVEGTDLGARCRREMMVASGLQLARDLTGEWVRPRRVCLRHREPRDSREHEAFFGCELRFEAEYDGLEFDRDTLAMPLPGADSALSQFLLEHSAGMTEDQPSTTSLEWRVRLAIHRRLGKQTMVIEAVAQELGMSSRTLSRRLLDLGTSYHQVLDRVRRQLADELLDDPDNSLSEVAAQLGFSSASSFHRVYKRWTGRTPAPGRVPGL